MNWFRCMCLAALANCAFGAAAQAQEIGCWETLKAVHAKAVPGVANVTTHIKMTPELATYIAKETDPIAFNENATQSPSHSETYAPIPILMDGKVVYFVCASFFADFRVGERSSGDFPEPGQQLEVIHQGRGYPKFQTFVITKALSYDAALEALRTWEDEPKVRVPFTAGTPDVQRDDTRLYAVEADNFGKVKLLAAVDPWEVAERRFLTVGGGADQGEQRAKPPGLFLLLCDVPGCDAYLDAELSSTDNAPNVAATAPVQPQTSQTVQNAGKSDVEGVELKADFVVKAADGTLTGRPFASFPSLACFLYVVFEDRFTQPPQCDGETFAAAAQAIEPDRVQFTEVEDGALLVSERGIAVQPERVAVTLRAGRKSTNCDISITYATASGAQATVQLSPVPQSAPTRYGAALTDAALRNDGTVALELKPNGPVTCGFASETRTLPARQLIEISFDDPSRANPAILHMLLPNTAIAAPRYGLEDLPPEALGSALVDMLGASHDRLARDIAAGRVGYSHGAVVLPQPGGRASEIVGLDADTLRSGVYQSFSAVSAARREAIANAKLAYQATLLGDSFAAGVTAAAEQGITDLVIVVSGFALETSSIVPATPCRDAELQGMVQQAAEAATRAEIHLQVLAYPIIKPQTDERVPLEQMRPITPSGGGAAQAGGLYECLTATDRQTPSSVTSFDVFPFYLEPWRVSGDTLGRYGAAVSDHLYTHLRTREFGP